MKLTDEQLETFIACWRADFGEVLTKDQARAEAMRLLSFFITLTNYTQRRTQHPDTRALNK
ncbi:MAG: hypothetical protein WD771_07580 [Gemmatimonadaceae bacterium]